MTLRPSVHFFLSTLLGFASSLYAVTTFAFPADFDGDGKSDPTVWRGSTGIWYVKASSGTCPSQMTSIGGAGCQLQWGGSAFGDQPISGDFDADGKSDFIVIRPEYEPSPAYGSPRVMKRWYIRYSSGPVYIIVGFGDLSDIADEADRDQNGYSDMLVYRPSVAGSFKFRVREFTLPGTISIYDTFGYNPPSGASYGSPIDPISKDYGSLGGPVSNPEAAAYLRIINYTPSNNRTVWSLTPRGGAPLYQQDDSSVPFSDVVAPGNFGGGTGAELVLWRGSSGNWRIRYLEGGLPDQNIQWGLSGDIPIAGDFIMGDGVNEPTVWRPSEGNWYVKPNGTTCPPNFSYVGWGACTLQWGLNGDVPIS